MGSRARSLFRWRSILITSTRVETVGEVSLGYPDWGVEVPSTLLMRAGDQATIRFLIVAISGSSRAQYGTYFPVI